MFNEEKYHGNEFTASFFLRNESLHQPTLFANEDFSHYK